MTAPDHDLDALADAWLDGEVAPAQWQALQNRHGKSLAIAEYQARERRAAVAALPRAELPAALRARLLAPASSAADARPATPPTPASAKILRFPWPILTTAVLAATLVIGVLQLREWRGNDLLHDDVGSSHPGAPPSGPVVARLDSLASEESRQSLRAAAKIAAPGANHQEHAEIGSTSLAEADTMPLAASEFAREAPTASAPEMDATTLARLRSEAERQVATAKPAATALAPADLNAVGPHALALVRREPSAPEGGIGNDVAIAKRRSLPQKAAIESTPDPDALAHDQLAPAAAAAAEPVARDPALTVVLYNRTVAPWTISASQVRIEALDASGTVIWSGRAAALGTLAVPAGGFVSVDLESADWPRETRSLRARVDDLRSPALEMEP